MPLSRSVRSLFVSFVSVMDKPFVHARCRYLLTSVKRRLLYVSVPAFQSQSLKIVSTEQSPSRCCGLSVDEYVQQCDC